MKKNCDNCKKNNTYFDCSQCSDFDEWEEKEDLIHNKTLHLQQTRTNRSYKSPRGILNFDLGNVVKYIARCEHKGNKPLDLNKALEYLQHEIKSLER